MDHYEAYYWDDDRLVTTLPFMVEPEDAPLMLEQLAAAVEGTYKVTLDEVDEDALWSPQDRISYHENKLAEAWADLREAEYEEA